MVELSLKYAHADGLLRYNLLAPNPGEVPFVWNVRGKTVAWMSESGSVLVTTCGSDRFSLTPISAENYETCKWRLYEVIDALRRVVPECDFTSYVAVWPNGDIGVCAVSRD